jgi:predicted deacylase
LLSSLALPDGAFAEEEPNEPLAELAPAPPLRSVPAPLPDGESVGDVTEPGAPTALPPEPWGALAMLGAEVGPGEKRRLFLRVSESFAGFNENSPVLVARGARAGPTLCVTGGVHGDELNGIEVARSVFAGIAPRSLSGTMVVMPVVNIPGFRRSSRYLPDRRDLNRYFPGHPRGSSASRIAHSVFESVIRFCDALLDLHTGSFHRTNMPQIRADLTHPGLERLATGFGVGLVVHSAGEPGTLRRAATDAGVAALTYEAGEPMRFQREEIERGVRGVTNLMVDLGLVRKLRRRVKPPLVFASSRWVRVDEGGIFITTRQLGDQVRIDDVLGTVTDPVSNERSEIVAPFAGRIIGMALSQVVIPGFAAFHLGVDSGLPPEEGAASEAFSTAPTPIPPDQLDSGEAVE